jgi:hypothetical protein
MKSRTSANAAAWTSMALVTFDLLVWRDLWATPSARVSYIAELELVELPPLRFRLDKPAATAFEHVDELVMGPD